MSPAHKIGVLFNKVINLMILVHFSLENRGKEDGLRVFLSITFIRTSRHPDQIKTKLKHIVIVKVSLGFYKDEKST